MSLHIHVDIDLNRIMDHDHHDSSSVCFTGNLNLRLPGPEVVLEPGPGASPYLEAMCAQPVHLPFPSPSSSAAINGCPLIKTQPRATIKLGGGGFFGSAFIDHA